MITVTGKTFEHRDLLRDMRGRFDGDKKHWVFDRLTDAQLARLRSLVGVVVNVTDDPPEPRYTFADLIAGVRRTRNTPSTIYGDDPTYHNYFADQNPAAFFGFSSLGAMTDYLRRIEPTQSDDERRAGWETDDGDWRGSRTMADALRLARDGWQEGAERAADAIERLAVASPRVKRRRASLAGGAVNVGRILSGDPAHMIRRPRAPGRKVVTLFVEAGCNGYITGKSIIYRAALIGALCDLTENAGYACTVVATDTSVNRGVALYQLAVTLKEAGERLNLNDVMFALGHPSFLRRCSFAVCASVPETREIWLTQGSSSNAFDNEHRCSAGEFYVPVLAANQSGDDPLELLASVVPDDLPVEVPE